MKIVMKNVMSMMIVIAMLSACSKEETPLTDNDSLFGSLKVGGINAANEYGLVCTISMDDVSLTTGDDFIIHYSIENTSETDIDAKAYIALELVYNRPNYELEQYWGDYYSLLWWEKTSWGRTSKTFELAKNSTFSQSVDFTDIGWISSISSQIQPDTPNFYELFGTGNFKFQLHISIDDNNTVTPPTKIFSNILVLDIE